eukprot:c20439_g1_i1.p1 GENE.c20439_g1_i1~~c20439_g1_i1.p1  ORF type:complete len:114 (+),score=19.57 c20439_g1_i1:43-384(+)
MEEECNRYEQALQHALLSMKVLLQDRDSQISELAAAFEQQLTQQDSTIHLLTHENEHLRSQLARAAKIIQEISTAAKAQDEETTRVVSCLIEENNSLRQALHQDPTLTNNVFQ